MCYPVILSVGNIDELNKVEHVENGICIGASVTLSTLEQVLKDAIQQLPGKISIDKAGYTSGSVVG